MFSVQIYLCFVINEKEILIIVSIDNEKIKVKRINTQIEF
ncbi:hypothetical protein EMIT036CA2_50257 [Chryseobacterium sp. IT-36CA2]